jgi:hypothetical protein
VNRVDTTPPTLTGCPGNQAVSLSATCDYTLPNYVTTFGITATDNCTVPGSITISQSPISGTVIVSTTTIIITAVDSNGNSTSCSFDVTPADNTSPTISGCPGNFDVSYNSSCAYIIPDYMSLLGITVSDNCDPTSSLITIQTPTAGTSITNPTTIDITVFDTQGNASLCAFTVTPIDTSIPTISCPVNITTPADAGFSTATIATTNPSTSDNCVVASITWALSGSTTAISPLSGINYLGTYAFNVGITNVTYTVSDNAGNTSSCVYVVTVEDNQPPVINCPINISQNADNTMCEAVVTIPLATATDNQGIASLTNDYNGSNDASDVYPVGTTTVIWTAIDNTGNSNTCSMTVTVLDTQNPTISCPANITVNADPAQCQALVNIGNAIGADNCGVLSITNNHPSNVYTVGITNVLWTVLDIHGNTATCTQSIVVNDNQIPSIICPSNISVNAVAGLCTANVNVPLVVTSDNCSIASIVNSYNAGGANATGIYPVGTTTVVYTVTDVNGNTNNCSINITVTDNQNPSLTCPANVTTGTDNGVCTATLTIPSPIANDNCAIASVTNSITGTNNASGVYSIGTTTIVWTATDIHGNTTTCTQTIVVADDEDPIIATCPTNQNVSANASCQFVVGDFTGSMIATDNCDATLTITQSPVAGATVNGTTTITLTATDDAGNDSACSFQLIVVDNTSPTITVCPPSVTVNVNSSCNFTLPDYTLLAAATDNCDRFCYTLTQSPAIGSVHSGHNTSCACHNYRYRRQWKFFNMFIQCYSK